MFFQLILTGFGVTSLLNGSKNELKKL